MGYLIRQASAGIGLVSESVKARKAKKQQEKQHAQQQHAETGFLPPLEETESAAPSYHTEDGRYGSPPVQNGRPSMQSSHSPPMNSYPPPMENCCSPPMGNNHPPAYDAYPPMHNGQPPLHNGQPPMPNNYPPMENNYPPTMHNNYPPPMENTYPPVQNGPPPMSNGPPPMPNSYLPMESNYPPTYTAYHPWQHGPPPMQNTYPPTENGYPLQSGYPPTHNMYPPTQTSREVNDLLHPTERELIDPKDEKSTIQVHEYDQESIYSRECDDVDKDIERQWELDEAQEHLRGESHYPTNQEEDNGDYSTQLAESFAKEYPVPASLYDRPADQSPPRLEHPVVLPQRRPKNRQRGFVRAYAPELGKWDIDDKMFLDFVDKANKSCVGSQWFQVINLAANVGGFFVSPTVGFVMGFVADAAVRIGMAVDGRRRSGNFFDQVNRDFFMPRGLFCLLMTYAPESKEAILDLDMNNTITAARTPETGFHRIRQKYQTANATANTTFDQFSPLVFPDLNRLNPDDETKKKYQVYLNKVHRTVQSIEGYYDKRDQAKFIAKNPNSNLAMGPKPEFTSRYADPTNKAATGSLLGLATGGKFTDDTILGWMGIEGRSARGAKPSFFGGLADAAIRKAKGDKELEKARAEGRAVPHQSTKGFVGGGLDKMLKRKVVYMMIVNMPSEEEMRKAREIID
ncbi:hypothetical protein ASPBRDRAFT_68158 [Aspergillus brasiliensis CBS 101740]|uniref:Uncharacterized protein n=1 Tax=Aspergillus brasiliensis (strain CBS 101740 / IMI 381727 / IBT 21946) TaxID=767769 RepID=A0A1L9UAB6_ASPBC|nr:hypothetical protein ASPBRDRAFT_68158 [Aspergillus brasiliensis CBS 101740]